MAKIKMFDDPESWSYRFAQAGLGGDFYYDLPTMIKKLTTKAPAKSFRIKLHSYRYVRYECYRVTYELSALNKSDAQEQLIHGPYYGTTAPGPSFRRISGELDESKSYTFREIPDLERHK